MLLHTPTDVLNALEKHKGKLMGKYPGTYRMLHTIAEEMRATGNGRVEPSFQAQVRKLLGLVDCLAKGQPVGKGPREVAAQALAAVNFVRKREKKALLGLKVWDTLSQESGLETGSGPGSSAARAVLEDANDLPALLRGAGEAVLSFGEEHIDGLEAACEVTKEVAEAALPYVKLVFFAGKKLYRAYKAVKEMEGHATKLEARMRLITSVVTQPNVARLIGEQAETQDAMFDISVTLEAAIATVVQFADRGLLGKMWHGTKAVADIEKQAATVTQQLTELHTLVSFRSMAATQEKLDDIKAQLGKSADQSQAMNDAVQAVLRRISSADGCNAAQLRGKCIAVQGGLSTASGNMVALMDGAVAKIDEAADRVTAAADRIDESADKMAAMAESMQGMKSELEENRAVQRALLKRLEMTQMTNTTAAAPASPTTMARVPTTAQEWVAKGDSLEPGRKVTVGAEEVTKLQCYEKALAIDCKHSAAWTRVSATLRGPMVCTVQGKRVGKDEALRNAVIFEPNVATPWYFLGCHLAAQDEGKKLTTPQATLKVTDKLTVNKVNCFAQAIKVDPNFADAYSALAMLMTQPTQFITLHDKQMFALDLAVAAIAIDDANPSAWLALANALRRKGDKATVKVTLPSTVSRVVAEQQAIETTLSLDASQALWDRLVLILHTTGKTATIGGKQLTLMECAIRAVKADPTNHTAYHNLSYQAPPKEGYDFGTDVPPEVAEWLATVKGGRPLQSDLVLRSAELGNKMVSIFRALGANWSFADGRKKAVVAGKEYTRLEALEKAYSYDKTSAEVAWHLSQQLPGFHDKHTVADESKTAVEFAAMSCELDAGYASRWVGLGLMLAWAKRETAVVKGTTYTRMDCFGKALEVNPTWSRAYFKAGTSLKQTERVTLRGEELDGVQCMVKAIESVKDNALYWMELAETAKRWGLSSVTVLGKAYTAQELAAASLEINPAGTSAIWNSAGLVANPNEGITVRGIEYSKFDLFAAAVRCPNPLPVAWSNLSGQMTTKGLRVEVNGESIDRVECCLRCLEAKATAAAYRRLATVLRRADSTRPVKVAGTDAAVPLTLVDAAISALKIDPKTAEPWSELAAVTPRGGTTTVFDKPMSKMDLLAKTLELDPHSYGGLVALSGAIPKDGTATVNGKEFTWVSALTELLDVEKPTAAAWATVAVYLGRGGEGNRTIDFDTDEFEWAGVSSAVVPRVGEMTVADMIGEAAGQKASLVVRSNIAAAAFDAGLTTVPFPSGPKTVQQLLVDMVEEAPTILGMWIRLAEIARKDGPVTVNGKPYTALELCGEAALVESWSLWRRIAAVMEDGDVLKYRSDTGAPVRKTKAEVEALWRSRLADKRADL